MSLSSGLRKAIGCQASSSRHGLVPAAGNAFSTSAICASGSNKWSKIKHVKEKNDAKKGSGYSGLSQEIITAVRAHPTRSTSPETNAKLAMLLRRARTMDVSKDKIEATLKKAESMGTATSDGQLVTYEALGPLADNGLPIALIVECQTDSPGRTHARVKEAFNKHGVRLSSTEHMFERKGVIRLSAANGSTFDAVFEAAVDNGAEDVQEWDAELDGDNAAVEVTCDPSALAELTSVLNSEPYSHTIIESQVMMRPVGPVVMIRGVHDDEGGEAETEAGSIGWLGEEDVTKLDKMVNMLFDNADCTRIWSNVESWPSR